MALPSKRSVMTLFSNATDPYSHRVRFVLAEKGMTVDILDVDKTTGIKEELYELNPYGSVPTLLDRELILYRSELIMEYLDERFPHPPLMPVYPIARARTRLMIYRMNRDWYTLMDTLLADGPEAEKATARKELSESLTSVVPIFKEMSFFMSETFSVQDCCVAPLLWRLPLMGIQLPPQAQPVLDYATRLFERTSFQTSLTEAEQAMR